MVERVAVGEIRWAVEVGDAVGLGPAVDDVAPDVAPDDGVVARHVDRALGPQRAAGEPDQFGVGRHETLESRIADDPLDRARGDGHRAPPRSVTGDPGACSAVAVLGQVEPEVERDLEQDEHHDRRLRGAGHRDHDGPDEDRDMQDDQATVRREHLLGCRRSQVFPAPDVVEQV